MKATFAESDSTWRGRFIHSTPFMGGLMIILVGLLGAGYGIGTIAHEGTPASDMTAGGVIFEPLAFGSVATVPAAPASFQLARARIEPGGHISVPANGPGLALFYVESGTLTCSATTSTNVMRAAMLATPEVQPFEEVAAGTEFTVGPGDSFIGLPNAGGEFRNEGAEDVVLLVADLHPETAGTPAP
jgi:mannose-6-phosphate isomerase-like protein (cupin superfamily)